MIHSQFFKRSVAALLTLAMTVSLCAVFAGTGEAASSLPAVEAIKANLTEDEPYTVLEIVPDAAQGSIGYYVNGYEPWRINAGAQSGSAERAAYVNNLRSVLSRNSPSDTLGAGYSIALCDPQTLPSYTDANGKLVSASLSDYPLNWEGAYSEVYPWDKEAAPNTYATYDQLLPLARLETKAGTLDGTMTYEPDGSGSYNVGSDCLIHAGGSHVQIVRSFQTEATENEVGYWYNVSFSPLSFTEAASIPDWTLVYRSAEAGESPDITADGIDLIVVGVVGTSNFPGLETTDEEGNDITYYRAVWGAPSAEKAGNMLWAAAADSSSFRPKEAGETGQFSPLSYEYVGENNGYYSFSDSGSTPYVVSTRLVWFKGGFTNNNWFAKYVMDWSNGLDDQGNYTAANDDGDIPPVDIKTVALADLRVSDVKAADMIIINYGFNLSGTTYKTVYCNDFSSTSNSSRVVDALALVKSYATGGESGDGKKKPIVVDYSLAYGSKNGATTYVPVSANSSTGGIKATVTDIITAATANRESLTSGSRSFVGKNIYVLDSYGSVSTGSDGTSSETQHFPGNPIVSRRVALSEYGIGGETPLEIVNFSSSTLGLCASAPDPFYPIAEGIIYENFLRRVRYGKNYELLTNETTNATALRYIINAADARTIENKSVVRLLDIEPRTGIGNSSTAESHRSEISGWLGLSNEQNLQITTMSISEFNAVQADISETFDMVYIGDSVNNFKTDNDSFKVDTWLGMGGTTYSFKKITYNDADMTYASKGPIINPTSVQDYISRRVDAGWANNYDASGLVFGYRYSSIGETMYSGGSASGETGLTYRLSGILDRDYNNNIEIINKPTSKTFRASGNDLTDTAYASLKAFADLGYPIIFSDTLLRPPEYKATNENSLAKVWLEGEFTGIAYANIAYATPYLKCEGDVLLVDIGDDNFYRWKIRTGVVSLYRQEGDEQNPSTDTLIDSEVQSRGNYSVSFDLGNYETSEDDLIKPGAKFYCTYRILTCFQPFANLIKAIGGSLFAIRQQPGYTQTVTIRGDAEEMFVDNASNLFSLINELTGQFNIMSYASLSGKVANYRRTLLPKLVNLSKPEITFLGEETSGTVATLPDDVYPTIYTKTAANGMSSLEISEDGDYILQYKFKIQNDADPNPDSTRYALKLYLDSNGNGKYEAAEEISDLPVRELTVYPGGTSVVGDRVDNSRLLGSYGATDYSSSRQHYYYAYYTLPPAMQGLIPWKLEVTEIYGSESSAGGHYSVTDYTRVLNQKPKTISILQIDSADDGGTIKTLGHDPSFLNLEENIKNGYVFSSLLNDVSSDFKVDITTVVAGFDTKANGWSHARTGTNYEKTVSVTSVTEGVESVSSKTAIVSAVTLSKKNNLYYKKETATLDGQSVVIINDVVTQPGDTAAQNAVAGYSLSALLQSYDMLIIGFGDAYNGLGLDAAIALREYILADKPVLMAHDTTSFYSYENYNMDTDYRNWRPADSSFIERLYGVYGYYVNILVRDLIGLDRYGVTSLKSLGGSNTVGLNKYAGATTDGVDTTIYINSVFSDYIKNVTGISSGRQGIVSGTGYASLKEGNSTLTSISQKGYSIAWKPGSRTRNGEYAWNSDASTVGETQGLTTSVLLRFLTGSSGDKYSSGSSGSYDIGTGLKTTTAVTQINRGQITTYPYDINTQAFSRMGNGTSGTGAVSTNTKTVPETHGQNYQLNLNYSLDGSTSDMIVWYSLYGDVYEENDAVNNYYVYTVGNVTYTGSGHDTTGFSRKLSSASSDVVFEAQLFVNTMVAAYRANEATADVSFTNKTGTETDIKDFFVLTDGGSVIGATNNLAGDETRKIYFTVSDHADNSGKQISASFRLGGRDLTGLTVYHAENNQPLSTDAESGLTESLSSSYTYYITLDDLLAALGTTDIIGKSLTLNVSTTYANGDTSESSADLGIRQYKLFDLS